MAIPRRGFRPITVDGVGYRWRVRRGSDLAIGWGNTVVVISKRDAQALLVVELPYPLTDPWLNINGEETHSVVPSEVAKCIDLALKRGWRTDSSSKPFRLSVSRLDLDDHSVLQ